MEFGRRARAGRRGDPEPSGPAPSSGDGQLDYLDPDLLGGDSPGTPEDRSPRAKSRGGTPRKAQVGSIADDFDEDTDDEGAAPPSRGLDAAGGWGDDDGGGRGHGGHRRRPDPRAPRGGFFDEDENDDAPTRLEGRRQATGAMSPPPQQRPGGIAADFDDESPARPALSGVSRRKAREMEEDDSYMMVDRFADLAVRGGARSSPDTSLRSGRRIDAGEPDHPSNPPPNNHRRDRDDRDLNHREGVETAVEDIASIPDAEFGGDEFGDGNQPAAEVADVPRGYVNRHRQPFVMPDDLAKEAPERFEPGREEYRREGRDDLDDEIDLSPLLAQLMSREEAFAEDPDEVWTADSLWAEIRGVLQAEADEKARAEEELEKLEREREKI